MRQRFWNSTAKAGITTMALAVFFTGVNHAENGIAQTQPTQQPKKTTEPVFRVPKVANEGSGDLKQESPGVEHVADSRNLPAANSTPTKNTPALLPKSAAPVPVKPAKTPASATPHPLDRAVCFAEVALKDMQDNVNDYTAILSKRERVDGVVGPPSYMNVKIRCPRTLADGTNVPFSIYMRFLKPKNEAGREVIWMQGENDNNLVVHEGSGLLRLKKFTLDPAGTLAMRGQRYPIYEAGLENLIVKLIEKAERDRAAGPCEVTYREGAQINKRSCSLIELVHEEKRAPYEFFKAQVFIDDELNLPVRFVSYDWPASPGAAPELLEEYTYYNVKTNVGLKDIDFSTKNPSYRFPKR